jgi:ribosomal-protein-alanine N-acetyltransferase
MNTKKISIIKTEIETFDDLMIDCSLSLPDQFDLIAVLVHGSFNQDKDGNLDGKSKWMFPNELPKRNLFIDIENRLLANGVAALRYDKRSSGHSQGVYEDTDMDTLAKDLNSIISYLKEMYCHPVIVIGHSEGSQTATYCQHLFKSADALILQGANYASLVEMLEHQKDKAAKMFLEANSDSEVFRSYPYLTALYKNMYDPQFLSIVTGSNVVKSTVSFANWTHLTNIKKYRQYGTLKIEEMIQNINIPIEIIHGTEDANCNIDFLKRIHSKLLLYSNINSQIIENLDHSFRRASISTPLTIAMNLPIDEQYFIALEKSLDRIRLNLSSNIVIKPSSTGDYDLMVNEIYGETSKNKNSVNLPPGFELDKAHLLNQNPQTTPFFWSIYLGSNFVGSAYHIFMPRCNTSCFALGISEKFRGNQIGTLATKKLISLIFKITSSHRIETGAAAENLPSNKVLKKCGFTKEGVSRQAVVVEGVAVDQVLWGLLRDEMNNEK